MENKEVMNKAQKTRRSKPFNYEHLLWFNRGLMFGVLIMIIIGAIFEGK